MGKGLIALILAGIVLGGLYLSLMLPASSGQGYPGPRSRGSFWYFGGPTIYQETPSVRTGSPGGPGHAGGGPRAGK
jgi:hypothetical protein